MGRVQRCFEVVLQSVRWGVQQGDLLEGFPFGQSSGHCYIFFVVVVVC